MKRILSVKFNHYGQIMTFCSDDPFLAPGDHVLAETGQGLGFGVVITFAKDSGAEERETGDRGAVTAAAESLPLSSDMAESPASENVDAETRGPENGELNGIEKTVSPEADGIDGGSEEGDEEGNADHSARLPEADPDDNERPQPDAVAAECAPARHTTERGTTDLRGTDPRATAQNASDLNATGLMAPAGASCTAPRDLSGDDRGEVSADISGDNDGDTPALSGDTTDDVSDDSDETPDDLLPDTAPDAVATGPRTSAQSDDQSDAQSDNADDPPPILRRATPEDLAVAAENLRLAEAAHTFCDQRIRARNLDMKLVGVEPLFDRSKLIFYFTAPTRIDFRELVKDLVREYHTRIELRQIGVRHETQMLGAVGSCGMVCCCRRFLRKFVPVTIKMAKEQNLFLNPSKISGICGRLLCCLSYEQENYDLFHKQCPRLGKRYMTTLGTMKVLRANMFRNSLVALNEAGEEVDFTLEEWQDMAPRRTEAPLAPRGDLRPRRDDDPDMDDGDPRDPRPADNSGFAARQGRPLHGRPRPTPQAPPARQPRPHARPGRSDDDNAAPELTAHGASLLSARSATRNPQGGEAPLSATPDRHTPERADRTERPERTDRPDRFERPERSERPDRTDRFERPERAERFERAERPERGDRFERSDRPERPDRAAGLDPRNTGRPEQDAERIAPHAPRRADSAPHASHATPERHLPAVHGETALALMPTDAAAALAGSTSTVLSGGISGGAGDDLFATVPDVLAEALSDALPDILPGALSGALSDLTAQDGSDLPTSATQPASTGHERHRRKRKRKK